MATTCVSLRPCSTVAGCREVEHNQITGDEHAGVATSRREEHKRQTCTYFETKLKIGMYLRDKRNEERPEYNKFIRINSKLLRCSYQIPIEGVYPFLERLYKCLSPGYRLYGSSRSGKENDIDTHTRKERKSLRTLYDWMSCTDMTVQVYPKAPTVLWLDVECMQCKSSIKNKEQKHFKSLDIITTVVCVVMEYTTASGIEDGYCCDTVYVTRGKTCGMHVFFPRVILNSEDDVQDIWSAVNKRLEQTVAVVDTGCSAMPLPLSRNHNGLSRVDVKRGEGGKITVRSFQLTKLSMKDLAGITNFHHLIAEELENSPTSSSSSSVVSAKSDILTDCSKVSNKRKHETSASVISLVEPKKKKGLTEENVRTEIETRDQNILQTDEEDNRSPIPPRSDVVEIPVLVINNNDTVLDYRDEELHLKSQIEACPEQPNFMVVEDEPPQVGEEKDDHEERVSNASTGSSKRLIQSDIREICAKVNDNRRRRTSSNVSDSLSIVPQEPQQVIVLDDEDECMPPVITVKKENSPTKEAIVHCYDDAASHSICMGYAPSERSSQLYTAAATTTSVISTGDEEEDKRFKIHFSQEETKRLEETSNSTSSSVILKQPDGLDKITAYTFPNDARLPQLYFPSNDHNNSTKTRNTVVDVQNVTNAKDAFENNMKLRLDRSQNPVHETDMQLITSTFNTEVDFYVSMLKDSVPVADRPGLRIKPGCSLNASRENCPSALFQEYVPHVLYAEDFVSESEWIVVLVRYFDEYLNNAPFLYVMSQVLKNDENVLKTLSEPTRRKILDCTEHCLLRFKLKETQTTNDGNRTNHTMKPPLYEEKCTLVMGLIAVCSLAFKIVTPIFTDLAKICRMLLGSSQQTSETLNTSTMPTTGDEDSYDSMVLDDPSFDDSVSQAGEQQQQQQQQQYQMQEPEIKENVISNSIGNDHSVIASILRWNYSALDEQTLWCLFFYYYHVHADGLTRIMNEVVHGGLLVTAVLQAYFESVSNNMPVDIGLVCRQVYLINYALQCEKNDTLDGPSEDGKLMPPPKGRGRRPNKRNRGGKKSGGSKRSSCLSFEAEEKREEFEKRNENAKTAQRKVQEERNGRRKDDANYTDEQDESASYGYRTDFTEVLGLIVYRYLRPVSFDETTVVYTEAGYEQRRNEFDSAFTSGEKEEKAMVKDVFSRATLKYSMPHGDLSMYNTDVMGTVHRRSSCTNNLVLNIFENMYGGCMTYLTRRYNNNLKLFNRFNGDAYLLVVECRHAIKEFIQSIELSYINLILRQPIVPPVLEHDIATRNIFMSEEEIMKGSFVCLNSMDYVRVVNMFTRHSKYPQENCLLAEAFLDRLITTELRDMSCDGDEEASMCFRTIYLFFLLYIFEVLYKIRHAYNRDRTYQVSIERLSWDMDIRLLLKLFFGAREFKMPQGLSADSLKQLNIPYSQYNTGAQYLEEEDELKMVEGNRAFAARCINTRPTVSTVPANKVERMIALFKQKGIVIMKSYAAPRSGGGTGTTDEQLSEVDNSDASLQTEKKTIRGIDITSEQKQRHNQNNGPSYEERDRAFLDMTQAELENILYSSASWYENCHVRMKAIASINEAEKKMKDLEMCMDAVSMDTFLRTQLRVIIDNDRLNHIDRAVRESRDFAFCTHMPLRTKIMALVLATHSAKRLTPTVATDFIRKEYRLERTGAVRFARKVRTTNETDVTSIGENNETRPDLEWENTWKGLLSKRRRLLMYCRSLADTDFPDSYFIALRPDESYNALYNYMLAKPQYKTLHLLQHQPWAKDVCVAMNFLLVMNAYDTELVELCLRLFLAFEWPGQWAKRIFVWKSNSNAGKSFFFENIISKVFEHSTTINDPKGGKENAPEKSEYYKNFLLMINEFTTASSCELKRLCSTSGYKFRMNFGNRMIQAYMVGKMVFNCNTLPLTTDHATIQRVALIPLPFWFHKRQTVVDSMLNWTIGQPTSSDYEKNFRRKISKLLTPNERQLFIDNPETKNENDLFNEPDESTLKLFNRVSNQKTGASMFLVQNKTSQVYLASSPATGTIVSGIMLITRYFCRFRYFNKIKEPVDFSTIPTACTVASQEWERFSQPYYEWKERYRVEQDSSVRTKVSVIHASLSHFAKNYSKNTSFFDLRQFFEVDFVDSKIQYYNTNKEDEYYVRLDPLED